MNLALGVIALVLIALIVWNWQRQRVRPDTIFKDELRRRREMRAQVLGSSSMYAAVRAEKLAEVHSALQDMQATLEPVAQAGGVQIDNFNAGAAASSAENIGEHAVGFAAAVASGRPFYWERKENHIDLFILPQYKQPLQNVEGHDDYAPAGSVVPDNASAEFEHFIIRWEARNYDATLPAASARNAGEFMLGREGGTYFTGRDILDFSRALSVFIADKIA